MTKIIQPQSLSTNETDTYEQKKREEKEKIPDDEVVKHWNIRAKREGLQAVMSSRYSIEENEQATNKLRQVILKFLKGYISNKNIFELGVGIGRMTTTLASRAKSVTGIDLSPIMLNRAHQNLEGFKNVTLLLGKITDLEVPPKSFDLVFDLNVLLHIVNPQELRTTVRKMQELSDIVFLVEHTYQGHNFPSSKYTILRKPQEYVALLSPFKLVKEATHMCIKDRLTLMLFTYSS